MQDMCCDMTPLQQRLYDTVMTSQQSGELTALLSADTTADAAAHGRGSQVLEALTFLRKLCSHPLLVFDWQNAAHVEAVRAVLPADACITAEAAERALAALEHSPKLAALRELLTDCGILSDSTSAQLAPSAALSVADATATASAAHRVLVFAQLKGTLDLVEQLVLQPGSVAFVRLDGDVPPAKRQALVQRFNSDPTVDVMLLTTAVGGLGLNLTSADTVVFLEHDWNPMKDVQVLTQTQH